MNTCTNTIRSIRIVHNGYKIIYPRTMEEVYEYIDSILEPNRRLGPEKICDKIVTKDGNGRYTKLIRYRYSTIYEEVFLVDVNFI